MELTHASLTELAVRWLKRSHSQNGPGCHIAVSECRSGLTGEIPDAIGWRVAGHNDGSTVVEVKASRGDFLTDKNKPHRNGEEIGLGNWRYYLCPEGVIKSDDLPEDWGLLWVNSRGHIKPQVGPMTIDHYTRRNELLQAMRHDSDPDGERFILVKLLNRVGDAEELNKKIRAVYNDRNRLAKELDDLRSQNRKYSETNFLLHRMVDALREKHPDTVTELEALHKYIGVVRARRNGRGYYIQSEQD